MKGIIKFVIAGSIIIAIGLAIVLGTLAFNGWSVKRNSEFEMQTYAASENNTSIDITIGAGSVRTEFYDGDKITIDYPSSSAYKTEISENDGVFRYKSGRKWFWGSLDIPDTVIKLPKGVDFNIDFEVNAGSAYIASGSYGDVEIEVNAGSLEAAPMSCVKFDCEVHAGKLDVNGLNCPDVAAEVSAGTLSIDIDGAKADYDIESHVSAGSCNVSDQTGGAGKKLNVECSAGSIVITFAS